MKHKLLLASMLITSVMFDTGYGYWIKGTTGESFIAKRAIL